MKTTGKKELDAKRFRKEATINDLRNGIIMLDQMKKKGLDKYDMTQKEYAAERADLEAKLKKAKGGK